MHRWHSRNWLWKRVKSIVNAPSTIQCRGGYYEKEWKAALNSVCTMNDMFDVLTLYTWYIFSSPFFAAWPLPWMLLIVPATLTFYPVVKLGKGIRSATRIFMGCTPTTSPLSIEEDGVNLRLLQVSFGIIQVKLESSSENLLFSHAESKAYSGSPATGLSLLDMARDSH